MPTPRELTGELSHVRVDHVCLGLPRVGSYLGDREALLGHVSRRGVLGNGRAIHRSALRVVAPSSAPTRSTETALRLSSAWRLRAWPQRARTALLSPASQWPTSLWIGARRPSWGRCAPSAALPGGACA